MANFNSISPHSLMRLLGTTRAPTLIDLRIKPDIDSDPYVIPTSVFCDHRQLDHLIPDLSGESVVVICQKGKKLSHGGAALLRLAGIQAEVLEGGTLGWRSCGYPMIPTEVIPGDLWVTRHRPKIDRIACPWLIRRFVDPKARFLFVPPSEVADVADRYNATSFDTEDSDWSHHGEYCTFDTMIERFHLNTDPLSRMARIIRAADTNQHELAPEAAGLLALSVGLSRGFKCDLKQLEQGMALYDALYLWARDGQNETHADLELTESVAT